MKQLFEIERLEALEGLKVLDTPPEPLFDSLTNLAAETFNAPIALISLIDRERQWFKARVGLDVDHTARDISFCQHTILSDQVFIVLDTLMDERFRDNALVTGPPNVRFYAGAPLITHEGYRLGSVCIIDVTPRETFSDVEVARLQAIARSVMQALVLRFDGHERQRLSVVAEHQNRLLKLAESMAGVGTWSWDVAADCTTWSDQTYRIHGYEPSVQPPALEGVLARYHPDDARILADHVQRAVTEGRDYALQARIYRPDGSERHVIARGACQKGPDGTVAALVGTFQDITAQKLSEADLAQTSERLQLCMDLAGIGVWEMESSEGGGFSFDSRVREIYGFQVDGNRIDRESAFQHVHPEDRLGLRADGQRALQTGLPVQSFFRVQGDDGTVRHIEGHALASRNAKGRAVLVGLNRDISEDVARTAELETKRVEAEAAAIAKSQFLATMSHEIRTPMNGVIGMLTVLQRSALAPAHQEHAEIALKSANHLLHILDDILEVSRLEAGQASLVFRDFDPRVMAREVSDLFSCGVMRPGVELTLHIGTEVPPLVNADEDRVRQILTNFVGNAVKFTQAGRIEVEVGYRADDESLLIAVKDTGIGISPQTCKRLFGRFIQADASTTRRFGGTGLGLSICRQYADLMGGRIGVESEEHKGSRFWLEVPASAGKGENLALNEQETSEGHCLRLLVAEDNPTNQRVIAALLGSFGHSFTIVPDGEQAVASVSSGDFDAILMDVQMPVMDGPTATRRIRALGGRAGMLPIIALTANAMPGQRAEYLAAGMTDYVTKPIEVRALHAALLKVSPF